MLYKELIFAFPFHKHIALWARVVPLLTDGSQTVDEHIIILKLQNGHAIKSIFLLSIIICMYKTVFYKIGLHVHFNS